MPSTTRRIPEQQRELLRQRHDAELTALANRATLADRLAATEARRAEVLAEQDRLVSVARADLLDATRALVEMIGLDATASLTGTTSGALRRELRQRQEDQR